MGTEKGDAHIFKTFLSKRSTTSPIGCTPTHLGHSHFHALSICSHPCFPPACHQVLTKAQPAAEAAAQNQISHQQLESVPAGEKEKGVKRRRKEGKTICSLKPSLQCAAFTFPFHLCTHSSAQTAQPLAGGTPCPRVHHLHPRARHQLCEAQGC